ncbi:MAG: formate/nitrite transporter family protein [Bacteroidales bacterium]|nr:formate/nitrite transporter family protein [Bacteroidales bacterium]
MKISKLVVFKSAVMAGITIGIAGWGYLVTTNIIGAVLFAFGLLTVVSYKMKLYTGTAGFVEFRDDNNKLQIIKPLAELLLVLVGNIIGCLLVGLLARLSPLELTQAAQNILQGRLNVGPLSGGLLAIGCGFIMTTTVTFARKGQYLPLLFGVPLFIVCGFPHCVADAFYYLTVPFDFISNNIGDVLLFYISIVFGNFLGCNLYRIVMKSNPE